jgi:phosphate uptake regulator
MMDYRKLISFGKSSYVVSLPKKWVIKNKLKKGDLISLEDNEGSLVLFAHLDSQGEIVEQRIVIDVDGKSIGEIKREIIPAYINNYKMISVVGKELRRKSEGVKEILHNLMALEVMEHSADKIIARDFLNMNEISIRDLIEKMEASTRSMVGDVKLMFHDDFSDNISQRDVDVNRLSYLSYRAIRYALRNPSVAKQQFKVSSMELMNLWMLTSQLEKVANEAKRVARYMRQVVIDGTEKKKLLSILGMIEMNYLDMMKAYHGKDIALAHKVSSRKKKIVEGINEAYDNNFNKKWVGALTEHMKIMALAIHDIARSVYE